jgi:hypothetical protein
LSEFARQPLVARISPKPALERECARDRIRGRPAPRAHHNLEQVRSSTPHIKLFWKATGIEAGVSQESVQVIAKGIHENAGSHGPRSFDVLTIPSNWNAALPQVSDK